MGTSSPAIDQRLEARERFIDALVERYVPYLGLVIGTVLTPLVVTPSAQYWLVTGPLVLASAAWSVAFTWARPARAGANAVTGGVYVSGLLVLMALLVFQSPFYGFQAFAGYSHSFCFLRGRWRWVGVVATAMLTGYSQVGGGMSDLTLGDLPAVFGLGLINGVLGGGFTYFGALSAQQSEQRTQVIVELNEANQRLSESLRENADLHVRLLANAREAGVLDERARMAREIHDTIAQGLTGIVTQLEAAGAPAADAAARQRHLDAASALARESLTEARRSVEALAPGHLEQARLPEAIAAMAQAWAQTAEVQLVIDTTGEPRPLLPDCEVTLFRVAQEALANVARHASASKVGLTLSYMADVVVLDVRDDGVGFEPGGRQSSDGGSGFGLAAMEQRVRRVSGRLTVESAPGEGAALSASVPAIPEEVRA